MSQATDYVLANQSGANFRAELNTILAAVVSQNSGSTAPSTTYAYQLWIDTGVSPALLKLRNGANSAWITIGDVTATNLGLAALSGATFTGDVTLNAQSDLRFADSDSSNWVALQGAATIASNVTFTLPNADGSSGQFLSTNGSGVLSWASGGSGDVVLSAANAFTGANTFTNSTGQTFRRAATQDGILLRGRGGGTNSYSLEITPTTLTASRTLTAPDADTTIVGTDTTQTLTNKTLTDPAITGTILEDIYTISDGAAFEVDPSNGSVQLITLGASRTPKATNFAAGESVTLMVDDGSAYTLTWTDSTWGSGGVVWVGGTAPTLATTGYTVLQFWKVSTQVYGARVGNA